MTQTVKAETVTGDRSPAGGAGIELPLTQTTTGRLRVDAASSAGVAAQGSFTARSGSMSAGGTSQTLAAANTSRKYLLIQNPATATGQNIATAESLFIRFGASAAGVNDGTSFELLPGGSFESSSAFVSTEAVQVNATTINHRFIAVEA